MLMPVELLPRHDADVTRAAMAMLIAAAITMPLLPAP